MANNFEKSLRNMEREVVKKMGKRDEERGTRLDPYYKPKKINVRDLNNFLEEDDLDEEECIS